MRPILLLAIAALLLAVGLSGAQAGTGLYTSGDAQALLHSYPRSEDVFSRLSPRASLDIRPFQEDLRTASTTGMCSPLPGGKRSTPYPPVGLSIRRRMSLRA